MQIFLWNDSQQIGTTVILKKMTGNEEATVLDLEEIVDESLSEMEQRRNRYNLIRLEKSLKKLDELENELDEFLAGKEISS